MEADAPLRGTPALVVGVQQGPGNCRKTVSCSVWKWDTGKLPSEKHTARRTDRPDRGCAHGQRRREIQAGGDKGTAGGELRGGVPKSGGEGAQGWLWAG